MKIATNIHHVTGLCWKDFYGRRSKVKVIFNNRLQIVLLLFIFILSRGCHHLCTNVWMNVRGIHHYSVASKLTCFRMCETVVKIEMCQCLHMKKTAQWSNISLAFKRPHSA